LVSFSITFLIWSFIFGREYTFLLFTVRVRGLMVQTFLILTRVFITATYYNKVSGICKEKLGNIKKSF